MILRIRSETTFRSRRYSLHISVEACRSQCRLDPAPGLEFVGSLQQLPERRRQCINGRNPSA